MGRRGEFDTGHGKEINLTDGSLAGRRQKERQSGTFVHLPPDPEGLERVRGAVEAEKTHRRESKGVAARESDQNEKAKRSVYGLGGNKALRKHLAESHELWEEDAKTMERPHHYHRQWHTKGEYNPDKHEH